MIDNDKQTTAMLDSTDNRHRGIPAPFKILYIISEHSCMEPKS